MKRRTKPELRRAPDDLQRMARNSLRASGFLCINKNLLRTLGPDMAVYISTLADRHEYFDSKGRLQEDGSFYVTHQYLLDHTGLSERRIRKCKQEFRKLDVIYKTYFKGQPPKQYLCVDFVHLHNAIYGGPSLAEASGLTLTDPSCSTLTDPSGIYIETGYSKTKDKSSSAKQIQTLVDYWNSSSDKSGLPKVAKLTQSRKSKLSARIKEYGFKKVRLAIRSIHRSSFCRGGNDRSWKANIDFLLRPDTVAKALEGTYDNKPARGQGKTQWRRGRRHVRQNWEGGVDTQTGEPIEDGKWFPVLDEYQGKPLDKHGSRLWTGPGEQFVLSVDYPVSDDGEFIKGAKVVKDPKLFGLG